MGLNQLTKGKSIFLDSAPIIYFIEKHPRYYAIIKPVILQIDSLETKGLASTITLLEVLVHPLRDGNEKLASRYKTILLFSRGLDTHEISHEISERAALLRAKHGLKTPDAIQIATATHHKANYFLTNDAALKKVKSVKVLVLDDYLPVT